jgi:hypothetical protein
MATQYVSYERLFEQPDIGLALCWVMVAHDLEIAFELGNQLTTQLRAVGEDSGSLNHARFYTNRLLAGHINEAVAMTVPTKSSDLVMSLINEWEPAAESFVKLLSMSQEGANNNTDLGVIRRVRNRGLFHYFTPQDQNLPALLHGALRRLLDGGEKIGQAQTDNDGVLRRFDFVDVIFANTFIHDLIQLNENKSLDDVATVLVELARDVQTIGQPIGVGLLQRFTADLASTQQ